MKRLRITVEGKTYEVTVETLGAEGAATAPVVPLVSSAAPAPAPVAPAPVAPAPVPVAPAPAAAAGGAGNVPSPLAAVVVSIDVSLGQKVEEGQKLITLEAMKMNTFVNAPKAGTIAAIHVKAGDSVSEGQGLITLQ